MSLPFVTCREHGSAVARLGLGAGGPSRLGTRSGDTDDDGRAIALVERAVDLGITLIDTAETYGTEPHVAAAVRDLPASVRDRLTVCTKHAVFAAPNGPARSAAEFTQAIERSLVTLGVEAIDLEQVHGVEQCEYGHVVTEILPALDRARDAGKVRAIGLTEMFQRDTTHVTLSRLLDDVAAGAPWQSAMVGFNILNQSAAANILPRARELGVATLGMFAVRHAMSQPFALRSVLAAIKADPRFRPALVNGTDGEPLSWLLDYAGSIPEAAYRFCLSNPGPDVVLCGTGSIEHLEANVRAIARGPLPDEAVDRLRAAFGWVDSVTGNRPSR